MIENMLPEDIHEKLIEIVASEVGRDKFPTLMKLLQQFKDRIEYKKVKYEKCIYERGLYQFC